MFCLSLEGPELFSTSKDQLDKFVRSSFRSIFIQNISFLTHSLLKQYLKPKCLT